MFHLSCTAALHILPILHQPKQSRADNGTAKIKVNLLGRPVVCKCFHLDIPDQRPPSSDGGSGSSSAAAAPPPSAPACSPTTSSAAGVPSGEGRAQADRWRGAAARGQAGQTGQSRRGLGWQGCQMEKFDPFLSLDCARVEGMGAHSKDRKESNFVAQRSGAIVLQARRAKHIQSKNLAIAIWQPWLQVGNTTQRL